MDEMRQALDAGLPELGLDLPEKRRDTLCRFGRAVVEQSSEHPLAEAIMTYAREQNISPSASQQFLSLPGKGIQAEINGKRYYAGNRRLMDEKQIPLEQWSQALEQLADAGKTPLIFSDDKQVIGIIAAAVRTGNCHKMFVDGKTDIF